MFQQSSNILNNKKPERLLKTRLGIIHFLEENIFTFEEGLYGFSAHKKFILSAMPGTKEKTPFLVMQSLDDDNLCFIVLNSNFEFDDNLLKIPSLLQKEDINTVSFDRNVDLDYLKFGFFVSFHQKIIREITINTVAPLFFDCNTNQGWQIVLNNPAYKISETIGYL